MKITYTLKQSQRTKNIRIKIKPNLEIQVSAPARTSLKSIEKLVQQSSTWIQAQQNKMASVKSNHPLLDWKSKRVSYKGSIYAISINIHRAPKIILTDHQIIINPISENLADAKKTLTQWLKTNARTEIERKVHEWAVKMNVFPNKISYRQQISRWGSCTNKGNLSFNWRLIHVSPEALEYVVIHELAHITHQNHSPAFWAEVNRYCPEYKTYKKELSHYVLEII